MLNKITLFMFLTIVLFADKVIEINLSTQTLLAKSENKVALKSSICSGRVGYSTPIGKFKILGKSKAHISNRYPIVDKKANIRGGAKMPYMLRVTNTGIAIHAGKMVNYPDSHGCIRLPYGKAMQLFKWTTLGTKVIIVGTTPYDDSINQMRIGLLKNKPIKRKKIKREKINSVKWVDDHLSYYDNL